MNSVQTQCNQCINPNANNGIQSDNQFCIERLNSDQLLQLLQKAMDEEIELRNTLRSTMSTYITLICSIMAGVLTISSFSGVTFIMPLAFISGGLFCSCISFVAYQHYKSDYIRQVEAIVEQAKLQDILGLTNDALYKLNAYWNSESLLPSSFVETRKRHATSQDFIKWFIDSTDIKWIRVLYICFFTIGFIFFTLGCILFIL